MAQILNKDPKLVRLPMGPLIWPNTMPWYDFCHIRSHKLPLSPISEI